MDEPEDYALEGEATLFGFDSVPAQAGITPRSRAWRVGGALRTMAIFVVIAPLVAVIPPHAVWFIGALLAGAFLARKRYIERFTLTRLVANCPKCGGAFDIKSQRLRIPHPVSCDDCHHESNIRFSGDALRQIASD